MTTSERSDEEIAAMLTATLDDLVRSQPPPPAMAERHIRSARRGQRYTWWRDGATGRRSWLAPAGAILAVALVASAATVVVKNHRTDSAGPAAAGLEVPT